MDERRPYAEVRERDGPRGDETGMEGGPQTREQAGRRPGPGAGQREADGIRLTGPARLLIDRRRLAHTTVLQSFAFDERRGHLYAIQVMEGGVRLPGEPRAYGHEERRRRGDLCLNRLTTRGDRLGHMFLLGFGHGGAFGLEDGGAGGPALWTEWDDNPVSGYGRGICRFHFRHGAVLRARGSGLATYRPLPGTTKNHPAIDPATGRLLLRYRRRGRYRYAVYDLRRFAARDYRPLADLPQPAAGPPFQGMALHGDHVYQLTGSGYGPGNPPSSGGNVRLQRVDLHTGRVDQQIRVGFGQGLRPREPEGLAVLRGHGGSSRLCLALTSGPTRGRRYSVYAIGGGGGRG
ncbi:teichoic acid biosynthesis protein C [Streptomyces sp. NPDC003077]|uniref:phage baseplate protein n=1 Tax=Streptomyces sp. NPDC003077 TaxID=3154443 RepID=UPI0033BBD07A